MSIDIAIKLSRGDFHLDARFTAPANGVTAIYGPSGCGKTTLLRAIAGLESVATGLVSVTGDVWAREGLDLPVHKRSVGYVFQEPSLFAHLNVRQNLEFGQKRQCGEVDQSALTDLAKLLDLENLLDRSVKGLSGGEQQRIAIGRALLAKPKLLLMDEPLASLDIARKKEILPYLDRLHRDQGIPIFYVSHALDEVVRLADHLVLMEKGRVSSYGPLLQTLESNRVLDTFADEAFTLLQAKVVVAQSEYHLTEVLADKLLIRMPCMEVEEGQEVRLRLAAKDISLTLRPAQESSILNIFESQVISIEECDHPSQKLVRIKASETLLTARVSALSCEKLALQKGLVVYAQIKATSLIQ